MQSKCFWFQHNVCSVGTSGEIGSWGYDSSMHLQKASPSRQIFKALKTRAGHDLVHEFDWKTVLGPEHRKTPSVFVTNETQTGYQPDGRSAVWVWSLGSAWGHCNLCVSSWRSRIWTKMSFEFLGYFKSWKMNLWECCTQYASKLGKLSSGHGTEKVSFHSNPKERQCQRMFKLPNSFTHLTR